MVKTNAVAAALMAAVSFQAFAQVEVVDLSVESTRTRSEDSGTSYATSGNKPSPVSMTDFYFQLQSLQNEVQTLRGIVEEQSYELKKLKQQRLDDYMDLDRRLSQPTQAGAASTNNRTAATPLPSVDYPPAPVVSNKSAMNNSDSPAPTENESEDELTLYRLGIDAVLKSQDYDKALDVFNQYLTSFPQGVYAANAKYWLAQVYLRRDDNVNAERWFRDLVENHPAHQKTPEAQFKLGKVLHLLGRDEEAKAQLQKVAGSDDVAAKLAQDYLNANF
ncbi:MAG: YbgF trimerization domain-containing protein [Marinagarivorans sp.]|nr:YbgF trimerization domain-containing protein [Marinagarivorans sp.]